MGKGPIREELSKGPNHQGMRNPCVEQFLERGSRALLSLVVTGKYRWVLCRLCSNVTFTMLPERALNYS